MKESSQSKLPILMGRHAHAIFFDDVRMENTGKLLLLGVYPDILTVADFPASVTIHAMVTIVTPVERPFKELKILCFHDDELVHKLEVDAEALHRNEGEDIMTAFRHPEIIPVTRVQTILSLGPLEIRKPSSLRIRVQTESEILPAGALGLLAA